MSSPFELLPNELKYIILSYTDPCTVYNISKTSLSLKQFIESQKIYLNNEWYPIRKLEFTFNNKREFDTHDIIQKLNLYSIVNLEFYFEKPLHLIVTGMIRMENNNYYFNDLVKANLIYFYYSDLIEETYIEYDLNLSISFKNNKMDGIYFLTITGGENDLAQQTNNFHTLLAIPYHNGNKGNI